MRDGHLTSILTLYHTSLPTVSDLTIELPFTLAHPKPMKPVISQMVTLPPRPVTSPGKATADGEGGGTAADDVLPEGAEGVSGCVHKCVFLISTGCYSVTPLGVNFFCVYKANSRLTSNTEQTSQASSDPSQVQMLLVGASLSEPQFSDADGTFVRAHKFA